MKKVLSTIVLSALVLGSVAGCKSAPEEGYSLTASAGTEKYVTLLEERLDVMPDSLVIASGADTDAYGVDTSKFIDEEGYTIRADGGNVVILGKTDAGLDRAVRQFANYGNNENYSFTYGESYRVKELTIAGNNISEYAVVRPDDADECMRYATDELVKYTRLATGVTLPVYSVSDYASAADKPARAITLKIDYPTLGDEAFTIQVKNDGNLDILCGQYRGAMYGVYGLLYDMGWRFLGDGTEYLYEAESLDLTSDINRTEEPAIANRFSSAYPIAYDLSVGNRLNYHGRYVNDKAMSKYGQYGVTREACHGLREFAGEIDWGGSYNGFNGSQPCYTDEGVLQAIENHFRNYIEKRLEAGDTPGKELAYIDVSQFDSDDSGFCPCANCLQVISREGSHSAIVLRMTNRMADMAAEYSPEIDVLMLAYCGTNRPPRQERPRDNVKIAYCFYYDSRGAVCSNHGLATDECDDGLYSNPKFYKEFENWKNICKPGTLQVWYYPMNGSETAFQTPAYDTAFADMKYFIESGVDCVMFCEGDNNDCILNTALSRLVWDADITEEEYHKLLEEYFCIYYGAEAGKLMYEYAMMIVRAGDLVGCYNSWGSRMLEKVDCSFIASRFDYMVSLFDKALLLAESEEIQNHIEILRARMLYLGISVVHEDRYVNGSDEDRAYIAELYAEAHALFLKHNIKVLSEYGAPAEYDLTKTPSEHWYSHAWDSYA